VFFQRAIDARRVAPKRRPADTRTVAAALGAELAVGVTAGLLPAHGSVILQLRVAGQSTHNTKHKTQSTQSTVLVSQRVSDTHCDGAAAPPRNTKKKPRKRAAEKKKKKRQFMYAFTSSKLALPLTHKSNNKNRCASFKKKAPSPRTYRAARVPAPLQSSSPPSCRCKHRGRATSCSQDSSRQSTRGPSRSSHCRRPSRTGRHP
jgi:hypothetical protein